MAGMIPFIVLSVSFVGFLSAGWLGVEFFAHWVTALRWALALMFFLTGWAHFGSMRVDLIRMCPSWVPSPELAVTLTGVAEILGAVGLLIPALAPLAGTALLVLMIAMFPANIHAAQEQLSIGGRTAMGVLPRGVMQLAFLAAAYGAAWGQRLN